MEILGKGIIQFVSGDTLIASRGFKLFIKENDEWYTWCELPISFSQKLLSLNHWFSRLSRNEVYHLIKVDEKTFACFAFGSIFIKDTETKNARKIGNIKGSRPLCVCSDGEHLYYGVYEGNAARGPIELWSYSLKNEEWTICYTFDNIRHIHGVFWDEYESMLWVTTGDLDHESTIWKFDNNGIPNKIITGSQQTRAVDLVFTEPSILYATDAPDEENYIYKLDRKTNAIEKLQKVGGPVFYGCKAGDWIFFSTVVEPSKVNRTDTVELWGSEDAGKSWKLIKEFRKDILPKKLFQYGQINFPSGPGDGKNLYFSPYATILDHKILSLSLTNISLIK